MVLQRANDGPDPRVARKVGPFRLLSFDPGGTTGFATARWEGGFNIPPDLSYLNIETQQIGPKDHHAALYTMLLNYFNEYVLTGIPLEITCESFEFRQHMNKDSAKTKVELISKEYIGVIKLFCETYHVPLLFNNASTAKTFISDDKIKKLNLWQPGQAHANDALRHLLRYLVVQKKIRTPITTSWLAGT